MAKVWTRRTGQEIATLYESPVPIVAEWYDDRGGELTLYADGALESEGTVPVELLAFVLVEWHAHQRAQARDEELRAAC
jgi:hypothetical protein